MKLKEVIRRLRMNFWNEFWHLELPRWSKEHYGTIIAVTGLLAFVVSKYFIILLSFPFLYSFCRAVCNSIKDDPDGPIGRAFTLRTW